MPSIRQLLASAGIGMAQLHVTVNEREHPRGGEITGEVELEGGIAVQHVGALTLKLVSFRPSGKTTETREHYEYVLASGLRVLPRGRQAIPFRLQIPDDAFLTQTGLFGASVTGCRIEARADIRFAADPRASLNLEVTHHREVQALHAAMRRMGFAEKSAGMVLTLKSPPPDRVVTHYRPSESLKETLDGAILSVEVHDGSVTGELDLDPRETTLREKMRALVVTQFRVVPFHFEPGALLTPGGTLNTDAALAWLREALRDLEEAAKAQRNYLLRPSAAPTSDVLLRPDLGKARVRPDELLRPVDEGAPRPEARE